MPPPSAAAPGSAGPAGQPLRLSQGSPPADELLRRERALETRLLRVRALSNLIHCSTAFLARQAKRIAALKFILVPRESAAIIPPFCPRHAGFPGRLAAASQSGLGTSWASHLERLV